MYKYTYIMGKSLKILTDGSLKSKNCDDFWLFFPVEASASCSILDAHALD